MRDGEDSHLNHPVCQQSTEIHTLCCQKMRSSGYECDVQLMKSILFHYQFCKNRSSYQAIKLLLGVDTLNWVRTEGGLIFRIEGGQGCQGGHALSQGSQGGTRFF